MKRSVSNAAGGWCAVALGFTYSWRLREGQQLENKRTTDGVGCVGDADVKLGEVHLDAKRRVSRAHSERGSREGVRITENDLQLLGRVC